MVLTSSICKHAQRFGLASTRRYEATRLPAPSNRNPLFRRLQSLVINLGAFRIWLCLGVHEGASRTQTERFEQSSRFVPDTSQSVHAAVHIYIYMYYSGAEVMMWEPLWALSAYYTPTCTLWAMAYRPATCKMEVMKPYVAVYPECRP